MVACCLLKSISLLSEERCLGQSLLDTRQVLDMFLDVFLDLDMFLDIFLDILDILVDIFIDIERRQESRRGDRLRQFDHQFPTKSLIVRSL